MDYLELSEKLHNHLPGVEFIFSTTGLICRYGLKNTDLKLVEVKPAGQLWLKMIIAEYGKKSAPIVLFADYFNPNICRQLKEN